MEEVISQENSSLESDARLTTEEVKTHGVPLFHVSLTKLIIMFIATFGLYQVYWFYKQWQALKNYYDLDAWPIARSFFFLSFIHILYLFILVNTLKKIIESIAGIAQLWRHFMLYC